MALLHQLNGLHASYGLIVEG